MLCINSPSTDVYFNLAAEEYLLKNYEQDIFMLYQNQPSVIVGRFQNTKSEINLDYVTQEHIKIARRISGGGSVFHDLGNFNLAFISSIDNPDLNKIATQIIEFLSTFHIEANWDELYGIFINGYKISGDAQYIYKNRTLYHATLLYNADLKKLATALDNSAHQKQESEKVYVRSAEKPVANITEYLANPLPIEEFKSLIFNYFLQKKSDNFEGKLTPQDIATINHLKTHKYETLEWILKD